MGERRFPRHVAWPQCRQLCKCRDRRHKPPKKKPSLSQHRLPTHAPYTKAYLARMARRDGPDDHSVCEHNVDLTVAEAACPNCSPAHRRNPHGR